MHNRYGVDVAATRADDLDKKMILYVAGHQGCSVLDFGAGSCGQSIRLADAGAVVTAIDLGEATPAGVTYLQGDIRTYKEHTQDKQFDVCCFQRTIHYLPYTDALQLLKDLKESVIDRLYISVTGLESDIGNTYQDADETVEHRFCRLTPDAAETFCIHEPVCLYTPEEFIVLLQAAGWEVEECWVSAFGNIKAVCAA